MKMYLVGGIVRDTLMGLKPKDHDFTVVLPDCNRSNCSPDLCQYDPFAEMRRNLEARGIEIFVETPEFLTIRGRFSKEDKEYPGIAGDFVLARKDSLTSDGRRPDYVEPGTLLDDLSRRDFTVNAMAMSKDWTMEPFGTHMDTYLIDPFGGQEDLKTMTLRFVGDPMTRIREDALRVMRALRFMVTKGFGLDWEAHTAIHNPESAELLGKISEERRADELSKMFRFSTLRSLDLLETLPTSLKCAMFEGRVRLDSTLKS